MTGLQHAGTAATALMAEIDLPAAPGTSQSPFFEHLNSLEKSIRFMAETYPVAVPMLTAIEQFSEKHRRIIADNAIPNGIAPALSSSHDVPARNVHPASSKEQNPLGMSYHLPHNPGAIPQDREYLSYETPTLPTLPWTAIADVSLNHNQNLSSRMELDPAVYSFPGSHVGRGKGIEQQHSSGLQQPPTPSNPEIT